MNGWHLSRYINNCHMVVGAILLCAVGLAVESANIHPNWQTEIIGRKSVTCHFIQLWELERSVLLCNFATV